MAFGQSRAIHTLGVRAENVMGKVVRRDVLVIGCSAGCIEVFGEIDSSSLSSCDVNFLASIGENLGQLNRVPGTLKH